METQPIEIEEVTATLWNDKGVIRITEFGTENTYYISEFGNTYYCKNYPNLYGVVRTGWNS